MPGGDRTGPLGYGPMTGRRMGYCSGNPVPGYWYPGPGFRFGRGRGLGGGRGWSWRRYAGYGGYPAYPPAPFVPWEGAQMSPEKEIDNLKGESEYLKEELKRIEKRISELKGDKK